MRTRRYFNAQLALFALLSGADLFLTWALLTHGPPSLREGNPAAAWVLDRAGWGGLAGYKGASALAVAASAVAIAARRPRMAQAVLSFGCVTLAAVVAYSARFEDFHRDLGRHAPDEAAQAAKRARLDRELAESCRLLAFKGHLTEEMMAGRLDLRQAVRRLTASEFSRPGRFAALRWRHRLDSERDCWAANLLTHALAADHRDGRWRNRWPALLAEYRAHFRASTPAPWELLDAPR